VDPHFLIGLGDSVEQCPAIVTLIHKVLGQCLGTLVCCTGVTLLVPPLSVAPHMWPVVQSSGFFQNFPMPRCPRDLLWSSLSTSVTLLQGRTISAGLDLPLAVSPLTLQHVVCQCQGVPLSSKTLVGGTEPQSVVSFHMG
jgi:hypothetical protein